MRHNYLAIMACVMFLGASALAEDSYANWRGPKHDGKSPDTGLLKSWPKGGPKLLWSTDILGKGYSTVTVAGGMVYTTGVINKKGEIFAFDLNGTPKWHTVYGPGFVGGYPGARTTPTVDDGRVYLINGYGLVVCLDAKEGKILWKVDTAKKYGAKKPHWGIAESLLIDGDVLYCSPGGKSASIVALNKKTGKEIWKCAELTEKSAYCSPFIIDHGKRRILVTMLENHVVGLDPKTGKLLWKHANRNKHAVHAATPVYKDGLLYFSSGYGFGGGMLKLAKDGKSVALKWFKKDLDNHHGGLIEIDGNVYGSTHNGKWACLKMKTGKIHFSKRTPVKKGSLTFADGMFYCYGENGVVALVKPDTSDFKIVSSFKVTKGKDQHWAHPVVIGGRLYIRHGNALMVYAVKKK